LLIELFNIDTSLLQSHFIAQKWLDTILFDLGKSFNEVCKLGEGDLRLIAFFEKLLEVILKVEFVAKLLRE
jgi:hypothetical protein